MKTQRLLSIALSWIAAVLLTGCAALPNGVERPLSHAMDDVQTTQLAQIATAAAVGQSNDASGFRLLPNGDHAFDARIALARRAERSLDVQYYLLQHDATGLRLLRELRDAAQRGVRVRILLDDFYTAGQDRMLAALAAHDNVEIRLFNPLPSRGRSHTVRLALSLHELPRINHRMHNKLFIADNSFAVTGGRNIGDEYFMQSREANFIDLDVLACGPVVRQLSAVFDRYWNSEPAYPLASLVSPLADPQAARATFARAVDNLADLPVLATDVLGRTPPSAQLENGRLDQRFATAEVLADSPGKVQGVTPDNVDATVHAGALRLMRGARKSVTMTSPYFIPGPQGIAMMELAARHGVRLTLMTNAMGATDEPLAHFAYARYREDMLKAGVTVYELSPTLARESGGMGNFGRSLGRLHAKAAVVDERRMFIGSMNLDMRSRYANTESALVIDSPELAADAAGLLRTGAPSSAYRVRLAAEQGPQWQEAGHGDAGRVHASEPGLTLRLGLMRLLVAPFVPESLL